MNSEEIEEVVVAAVVAQLVDIARIAERHEVSQGTVRTSWSRGALNGAGDAFPEPVAQLGGRRLWWGPAVAQWAANRRPPGRPSGS